MLSCEEDEVLQQLSGDLEQRIQRVDRWKIETRECLCPTCFRAYSRDVDEMVKASEAVKSHLHSRQVKQQIKQQE